MERYSRPYEKHSLSVDIGCFSFCRYGIIEVYLPGQGICFFIQKNKLLKTGGASGIRAVLFIGQLIHNFMHNINNPEVIPRGFSCVKNSRRYAVFLSPAGLRYAEIAMILLSDNHCNMPPKMILYKYDQILHFGASDRKAPTFLSGNGLPDFRHWAAFLLQQLRFSYGFLSKYIV